MYQTILIPIDVNNAEKASAMLQTAERLGGKSAKLILLNIIESVPPYVSAHLPEGFGERVQAEAKEALDGIAKTTSLTTEVVVRVGHASPAILTMADEKKADAIIIASHRPGLENYFLGSTASRVVRHAKCSVVVMR